MRDITIHDWTKLGATIRAERMRAQLSQHELARRAGTSRSWLARIEAGHRGAEFEQIMKLLAALDLTMIIRGESDHRDAGQASASGQAAVSPGHASAAFDDQQTETTLAYVLSQRAEQAATRRAAWASRREAPDEARSGKDD